MLVYNEIEYCSNMLFSLYQVSSAISECACGVCGRDASPEKASWADDARRQSPSPTRPEFSPGRMEFSTTSSVEDSVTPRKGNYANLEPELEVARP